MTIEVDTSVVRGGGEATRELADDVKRALEYFDSHIDAWGIMMTALSVTIAAGATLGSATTTIEFVPLPEA